MRSQYLKNLVGDMMGGLMVIFLFIAVVFMLHQSALVEQAKQQQEIAQQQKEQIQAIAVLAEQSRLRLHSALYQEFAADFVVWQATLYDDNRIVFAAPTLFFADKKAELKAHYKTILRDFFPRYVRVLFAHKDDILVVHIEGHASTPWNEDIDDSYRKNMILSQQRALNALLYGYDSLRESSAKVWLRTVLAAPGYSSGQTWRLPDGREDEVGSRRVEFHVRSQAERTLQNIISMAGQ